MGYIKGFSWALPVAFRSAVEKYAFQEGDLLYAEKIAYDPHLSWEEVKAKLSYSIQLKYPKRIAPGSVDEFEGRDSLSQNWRSKVIFRLYDFQNQKERFYTSTQGALYNLLWTGDLSILNDENYRPKQPVQLKSLRSKLSDIEPSLSQKLGSGTHFVMLYDQLNNLLSEKKAIIKRALESALTISFQELTPVEAGFDPKAVISPTTSLLVFSSSASRETMEAVLKSALYKPNPSSKKDSFSVKRHGLLVRDASDNEQ